MCTTRRYLFLCSHPATHRFRNAVCASPSVRGCRIQDYNVYLRHPCKKCATRGMALTYTDAGDQQFAFDDEWHIPSRCFVNIGFRTLDPFNEDKASEPPTPTSPVEPPTTENLVSTLPLTIDASDNDRNLCKRLFRRLTKKKPSPCCAREAQFGAYEAVRLEEREHRLGGRIRDNRCESPI